jgi:RNA-directed DNA polymerase
MLAALDNGVKGGTWFSLIDKVFRRANLRAAFARVKANRGAAGVDHVSVRQFEDRLDAEVDALWEALRDGTYRPQAIRRVEIPKPGRKETRPLGIPTVRDRVVQTALRHVLEPIFERDFAEHSYGFRPGRGCKDALRRMYGLLKAGHAYVVDADLKSYFDMIPHDRLMARVKQKVSDGRVVELITEFLSQRVLHGLEAWTPEAGTPQGAVISPLLSNIYLDPLDHAMAEAGFEMVRYADDFVILCRSRREADAALEAVRQWVGQAGLQLHPDKTKIVNLRAGERFEFLGYVFARTYRGPTKKSQMKLKDALRAKTRRTNGDSLAVIIGNVNRILRGWFEYFKHSHRMAFPQLDGWLRRRLRSILRKRRRPTKGIAGRQDNRLWPNAFFAAQGLFCLVDAHAQARQSARR